MKKIIYTSLIIGGLILNACQSTFLDLPPLDSITDESYYKTPEQFEAAANRLYDGLSGWKNPGGAFGDLLDMGSDLNASATNYGRGILVPAQDDNYWKEIYADIRDVNILLDRANDYGGNELDIAEWVAVARFFRAYNHYKLLVRFGGVPIVTTVLDLDSPELFGKRNSRYEVMAQIVADLEAAIPNLRPEQNIPSSDKGKISKWAAEAFLAKVLLYEATWEKYVGITTDGDGKATGAGIIGRNEANVEKYLQRSVQLAKSVMDNGGFSLWNQDDKLDNKTMYYLFNLEDEGSNPAGLTKASNNEFILYDKYDFSLRQGGVNISHTVQVYNAPSRKFMDMILCSDGLPVEKSSVFKGYINTQDEYQNRDKRLIAYFLGNIQTGQGANMADKIPQTGDIVLSGIAVGGGSGYACRKFASYNYGVYRQANQESMDFPIIRLADVYLIYAEAIYELNGSITDVQLDESINKLRARVGLPKLTNSFVASNSLDMLTEIRRERAVELYMENSRFNDLKRWGIAEEALNEAVCGPVIEGTVYENNSELYNASGYVYGETTVQTGVGERRAVIIDPASNRNFSRKNYLYPIPLAQIQLNNKLLQNPSY